MSFPGPDLDTPPAEGAREEAAVLAGGCFWCVDAVFRQLDGVRDVVSGYTGDSAETADYRAVCSGTTNHAETVRVTFDPSRLTFGQLLKVFFSVAHDPTQLNRQGPDMGRQYRSAIFYLDDRQKRIAEAYIQQLNTASVFGAPIVTAVEPLGEFYTAEENHQDYVARNPFQPYVQFSALPKVGKTIEHFPDLVRQKQK